LVVGNVIIGMRDQDGGEGAKLDGQGEGRGEEGISLMATAGEDGEGDEEEGRWKGGGEVGAEGVNDRVKGGEVRL